MNKIRSTSKKERSFYKLLIFTRYSPITILELTAVHLLLVSKGLLSYFITEPLNLLQKLVWILFHKGMGIIVFMSENNYKGLQVQQHIDTNLPQAI